ncbi:MAG: hypothetical protein ACRDXE_10505 [Acidimicrobiales bacterium]
MNTTTKSTPAPAIAIRDMPPTHKHRLAIVPGIFGTVYGVNAEGEARYFDYDQAAAYAFAGVSGLSADVRRARPPRPSRHVNSGCMEANPGHYDRCLWVLA